MRTTITRVGGKGPAIRQVDLSGQDIRRSLERQQSIFRGLRVVEEQCGNGIGTDDLGCVERFRNMACRKVIMSKAINAEQANSSAAPLTSMFIHVSFREIECL